MTEERPATPPSLSDAFKISPRYAAERAAQLGDAAPRPQAPAPQFLPDLNVRLVCPECRTVPPNVVEEFASGDLVCADCGLVLGCLLYTSDAADE